MGNLGFLFSDKNRQIVIFTRKDDFDGNIILGFDNFDFKNCEFKFLSKSLKLEKFHILSDFSYKFGKFRVFNQRIIDFEDFIFLLKPDEYKKFRFLLQPDDLDEDILMKNTVKIYDYIQKLY